MLSKSNTLMDIQIGGLVKAKREGTFSNLFCNNNKKKVA